MFNTTGLFNMQTLIDYARQWEATVAKLQVYFVSIPAWAVHNSRWAIWYSVWTFWTWWQFAYLGWAPGENTINLFSARAPISREAQRHVMNPSVMFPMPGFSRKKKQPTLEQTFSDHIEVGGGHKRYQGIFTLEPRSYMQRLYTTHGNMVLDRSCWSSRWTKGSRLKTDD